MRISFAFGALLVLAGCKGLGPFGGDSRGNVGASGGAGGGQDLSGVQATVATNGGSLTSTGSGTNGGSGGGGLSPSCDVDLSAPHQDVRAVPVASRGVDSAMYARAALRLGLSPDPSVLRVDDFLSFYGSSPGYAGAPQDGEVEFDPTEGLVEARFWVPPPAVHVPQTFIVVLDLSLSMKSRFPLEHDVVTTLASRLDPAQGDLLEVLGWSSTLDPVYDGTTDLPLEDALQAAFAKPSGAGDLGLALDGALARAEAVKGDRHVLVLTDGGAVTEKQPDWSLRYAAEDVRLDVALLALSAELRDANAPARALRYNQELLTGLTVGDGARLFVTDAAGPVSDAKELFDSRFDALFGVAMAAPVAQISLPPFLTFAPQAGESSSGQLVARSAGYDHALTFRIHVANSRPNLPGICGGIQIATTLGPTLIHGGVLDAPTPLGATRAAVRAFVAALRAPTKASFSTAGADLAAAGEATCKAGPGSARLCSAVTEMTELLALYPTPPI